MDVNGPFSLRAAMMDSTAPPPNVFDCAESEADGLTVRGKVLVRLVDVWWKDLNAHVAAFVHVLDDFRGVAGFRREQRGHELSRVVGFQIRGDVREIRIRRRVRLVEAIARELLHQVEDLLDLLLWEVAFKRAFDKSLALLRHLLGLLLAHRAAEQVGVAQRVACEPVCDLHDLLLVDDDAVGFCQDFFQLGQIVDDLLTSVLAVDEVIDHSALDRSGTIESVERAQILDSFRLIADQNVPHAAGFELEDAAGETLW